MSNKKRARHPELSQQQPVQGHPLDHRRRRAAVRRRDRGHRRAEQRRRRRRLGRRRVTPRASHETTSRRAMRRRRPSDESATAGLDCTDPPAAPTDPQQFDKAPDPAEAEGKTYDVTVDDQLRRHQARARRRRRLRRRWRRSCTWPRRATSTTRPATASWCPGSTSCSAATRPARAPGARLHVRDRERAGRRQLPARHARDGPHRPTRTATAASSSWCTPTRPCRPTAVATLSSAR